MSMPLGLKPSEHILVLILFSLISAAFTYPLISHMADWVPGQFDTHWFLWELWHFSYSIDHGQWPAHTAMLFYPEGTSLYLSTITPLLSIAAYPLQKLFGLFAAYNTLYLLSYVLSGYSAYLLALHVTGDKKAAFIAGVIFAFSPYHAGHALNHLNLMSTQFVPLVFLAYLKLKEDSTVKNAVFLGVALALAGLSEMIYLAITLVAVVADMLAGAYGKEKLGKNFARAVFMAAVVFTAAILPYLAGMAFDLFSNSYDNSTSQETFAWGLIFSPDVAAFFVPAPLNPLFSKITSGFYDSLGYDNGTPVERNVYLGYSVILLAIAAVVFVWKDARKWAILFTVFFLLALGPVAKLLGNYLPLPLPGLILPLLPFSNLLRFPGRFYVIAMLCAAVMAAIGLRWISTKLDKRKRNALFMLVTAIIFIEYYSPIAIILDTSYSPFYDKIAMERNGLAVLDLPYYGNFDPYNAYLMYLQTVHQKPIYGGSLSRTPAQIWQRIQATSCISHLIELDIGKCNDTKELADNKIKYVVLHKDDEKMQGKEISGDRIEEAKKGLDALFGMPVYEDEKIAVYETG